MQGKQSGHTGRKKGHGGAWRAFFICVAVVLIPLCAYAVYDRTHPIAKRAFGIEGLQPGIEVIKPGEHGYRTVLTLYDEIGVYYPLDFRVVPCKDKSDDVYLKLIFYMRDSEEERLSSVSVIMRSPTRYYVEGDDREYEAYSDSPDWMALWENAEVPAIFQTSPPPT